MMVAAAFKCFFSSYFSFEVMVLAIKNLLILTEYAFYCIVQLYLLHDWDAPDDWFVCITLEPPNGLLPGSMKEPEPLNGLSDEGTTLSTPLSPRPCPSLFSCSFSLCALSYRLSWALPYPLSLRFIASRSLCVFAASSLSLLISSCVFCLCLSRFGSTDGFLEGFGFGLGVGEGWFTGGWYGGSGTGWLPGCAAKLSELDNCPVVSEIGQV